MCFDKGRPITTYQHLLEDHRFYENQNYALIKERNLVHYLEWVTISLPFIFKESIPQADVAIQQAKNRAEKEEEIHFHTFSLDSVREIFINIARDVLPELCVLEVADNRSEVIVVARKGN